MIFAEKPIVECEEGFYLANLDLPRRPLKLMYIISLISMVFIASFSYFFSNKSLEPDSFIPYSIVIILMLVSIIVNKIMQDKPVNWFSPDVLFVAMFVVFHFGYIIFYSFNIVFYDDEIFMFPD